MQHHRAPTRLLDWTQSPLVATYFAVNSHTNTDGAIWGLHRHSISFLSNDRNPPESSQIILSEPPEIDKIFFDTQGSARIYPFEQAFPTSRMIAQQGAFTVSNHILADHAEVVESLTNTFEEESSAITRLKFIIPAGIKNDIMKQLYFYNIRADSLFPGIDGLGRTIQELVRISK